MDRYEIIWKSIQKHGYYFDYREVKDSLVKGNKMTVICPIHGKFEVGISTHFYGAICPKCLKEIIRKKFSKTTEEFIQDAMKVHGDKCDYSEVNYVNWKTKVKIKCNICGHIFYQTPNSHLKGACCPKCAIKNRAKLSSLTTEEFIQRAVDLNGEDYDYSLVDYKNYYTNVAIKCNKCGQIFYQTPDNHLHGKGCPNCIKSKLENKVEKLLKENNVNFEQQKSFEWLRLKYPQRIDFYLSDYNIAIECQGEQHYNKKEDIFNQGGVSIKRDLNKKILCEENNIKLVYIFGDKVELNNIFSDEDLNKIYNSKNSIHLNQLVDYLNQ